MLRSRTSVAPSPGPWKNIQNRQERWQKKGLMVIQDTCIMWPGWNDKRPEISCKTRLNAKPANLEQLSLWELYNLKPVSWISWVLQKLLEMCLAFPEMLSFFIEVARAAVAAWTRAPKQICSSAKQPSQPFPTAPVTLEKSNFFFSHSGHKGLKFGGFATKLLQPVSPRNSPTSIPIKISNWALLRDTQRLGFSHTIQ